MNINEISIVTSLVGFLGVIFTIVALNNQLRSEFRADNKSLREEFKANFNSLETEFKSDNKSLRDEFKEEIKYLREDIKATNAKLDTFLLAIFKTNLPTEIPTVKKKDAA